MLDKELSKWEAWTGAPHKTLDVKWAEKSTTVQDGKPMGKGDQLKVFSMVGLDDGTEALKVSGKVLAALTTKDSFSSYRLRGEVKWGEKKYAPKRGGPRDSGLIYHSTGKDGVFWNAYKRGLEYQIQENENGDYYRINSVNVRASIADPQAEGRPVYSPHGVWSDIGTSGTYSFKGSENYEVKGGWNQVEIIVVEDRAIHLANGVVVAVLQDATHRSGKNFIPLKEGQIQIQCAGAEVFFRNLEMKKLTEMPSKYEVLFSK